jgi:hypothetical protein
MCPFVHVASLSWWKLMTQNPTLQIYEEPFCIQVAGMDEMQGIDQSGVIARVVLEGQT